MVTIIFISSIFINTAAFPFAGIRRFLVIHLGVKCILLLGIMTYRDWDI